MNKAKERYYNRVNFLMAVNDRQTAEIDSVYIDYIMELEAEKAELIELLSDIAHFTKIESKKVQCYPAWWHRMEDLLKKHGVEI